jgi:hypothetical protein
MRRLLLCLALLAPCVAAPADLHLQPVGTRVSGQFTLGPSTFYLPEGEWVLGAKYAWTGNMQYMLEGPKFARVVLFDVRGGQVARAIWVRANITPVTGVRGWVKEEDPCKVRADIHLFRELGENYENQYCIEVNHRVPFLVGAQGWMTEALGWLADNKLPVPGTMIGVEFNRIDRAYQDRLHYYFNPEFDGFAPSSVSNWKASEWHRDRIAQDPARTAYVQELVKWAGDAAPAVYAAFTDAKLRPPFPQPPFPAKR